MCITYRARENKFSGNQGVAEVVGYIIMFTNLSSSFIQEDKNQLIVVAKIQDNQNALRKIYSELNYILFHQAKVI